MKKGFTLVEFMVVIAILAVLATLLIPSIKEHFNNQHFKKAEYIEAVDKKFVPEHKEKYTEYDFVSKIYVTKTRIIPDKYFLILSTGKIEKLVEVKEEKYYFYQLGDKYKF